MGSFFRNSRLYITQTYQPILKTCEDYSAWELVVGYFHAILHVIPDAQGNLLPSLLSSSISWRLGTRKRGRSCYAQAFPAASSTSLAEAMTRFEDDVLFGTWVNSLDAKEYLVRNYCFKIW